MQYGVKCAVSVELTDAVCRAEVLRASTSMSIMCGELREYRTISGATWFNMICCPRVSGPVASFTCSAPGGTFGSIPGNVYTYAS